MKTLAFGTATIGAIGLALTATPAFAGDKNVPQVEVSTAGLDLSTAEGQRMLDQRITRAARKVCRVDYIATGTRIPHRQSRACMARARASAQRQVASIIQEQQRGG